jgi:hypothetical protein
VQLDLTLLRKRHKLRVLENRVLGKLFGPQRDKVTGNCIVRSFKILIPYQTLSGS